MTKETPKTPDESAEGVGLSCARCGCRHFETVETRPTKGGVRRRRSCRHCGRMETTIEKPWTEAGSHSRTSGRRDSA